MITDSHTHLYWKSFDEDRAAVLQRARAAGVERMLVVGTDLATSRAAFELAAEQFGVYPTAGIHPHDAEGATPDVRAAIEALCARPECVAVGETGLDYFKEYSPRAPQLDSFHWQLGLARRLAKPVIVHCREAYEDTARAIGEHAGVRGVMHCYTFGPDELDAFLDAGFYVSFSGVVTYKPNDANREAARRVPLDRLLIETDCPFLAPQPVRGKRNEPAHVVSVLEAVAAVRGVGADELAEATTANAARLFELAD
ncbi:MAG: TatD family hydrolase [Planctomycetota bacterium]